MTMMHERIACPSLREKVVSAETAASLIQDGMTVAFGGYTSAGYPKAIPLALAKRRASGESLALNVVTSSTCGPVDTLLGNAGIIRRRTPMTDSRPLSQQINAGQVQYCEQQMNKLPRLLKTGAFGRIQVAVVEALGITADGGIIPTTAIGMEPSLLDAAEAVIVEINLSQPEILAAFHDIYRPQPGTPIPLCHVSQRIGSSSISMDPSKVQAIVFTEGLDETSEPAPSTPAQRALAGHLFHFLEQEMWRTGQTRLPPIQTGFGNLASEVVHCLADSSFSDIEFYCGGLQAANLELLATGRAKAASCGSIQLTPTALTLLENEQATLRRALVIRNGEVTNHAETISRMAPITLTSGIEIDIYGNVNSSHVSGARVINGLGGGANFAENAGLSVMMLVSESKGGSISTIVPMVSHQDICEHDIDVVVTEHGVADLRGKTETERALAIIQNCTGSYRPQLLDYFERACATGGHHPVLLHEAFSWHLALQENGTMRLLHGAR